MEDLLVPLLVLAVIARSRLARLRRDDVGRAAVAFARRVQGTLVDLEGVRRPTPPVPARSTPPVPAAPAPAPAVAPEDARTDAPPPPPVRQPPVRVEPRPIVAAPAPSGSVPRRRRLVVGRDLIAAELLAAPVAMRRGGPGWP